MTTYKVFLSYGENTLQEYTQILVVDSGNKQSAINEAESLVTAQAAYENYVFGQGLSYSACAQKV